jgi:hypothetical protein
LLLLPRGSDDIRTRCVKPALILTPQKSRDTIPWYQTMATYSPHPPLAIHILRSEFGPNDKQGWLWSCFKASNNRPFLLQLQDTLFSPCWLLLSSSEALGFIQTVASGHAVLFLLAWCLAKSEAVSRLGLSQLCQVKHGVCDNP